MRIQAARILSLLLTGLIAGTFFYGTFAVLPTFYFVPPEIHLSFRTALMSNNKFLVMALVLLSIVGLAIYTYEVRHIRMVRALCLSALLLTIFSLVITRIGSVPINLEIKTWDPSALPPNWKNTLDRWDLYNILRTIASFVSFGCVLLADLWMIRENKLN